MGVSSDALSGLDGTPMAVGSTGRAQPSTGRRTAVVTGCSVVLLYTACSLFCWQHLVTTGVTTHMYNGLFGDTGQRVWFMGWLPYAIAHHTNPLVSTYMFAPQGFNLLTNANVLLEAFLLAPITELSSPLTSFNVACIAAPVVSALSLYYVLRRYHMHRSVAFVGGLIFGFSPAILQWDQLGDLNLSWMFFPPLALYLVDRIFFRQTGSPVRLGLALGLLVVAQFFSGTEMLLDFAVVVVPVIALAMVANVKVIRSHVRFALAASTTALVTAGALLAYPLAVYLTGPDHVALVNAAVLPGAALPALVWPSKLSGASFLAARVGTPLLKLFDDAFIGPLVVLVALAALAFGRRHRVVLLLWAAALWCVTLSWGAATRLSGSSPTFSWHGPASYLSAAIPILKNVDWIRISIFADLVLAVLVAITLEGVASWFQARAGRRRYFVAEAITVGAGALMAIPLFVAGSVPYSGFEAVKAPSVLRHIPNRADGSPSTALIYPGTDPFHGIPLAWQALAGFSYRDHQGYAWHPRPGKKTAVADPTPGLLYYVNSNAPKHPSSIVLNAKQKHEVRSAFARNGVTEAVVVDGFSASRSMAAIYNQTFGPGQRFGDGEIWSTTRRR
jgi:hypothetical protein